MNLVEALSNLSASDLAAIGIVACIGLVLVLLNQGTKPIQSIVIRIPDRAPFNREGSPADGESKIRQISPCQESPVRSIVPDRVPFEGSPHPTSLVLEQPAEWSYPP